MKKFFSVIILASVLILFGNNQAEAREVYVGSYSDGTGVYLLTETVHYHAVGGGAWDCKVRAGNDYLNYQFWVEDTGWQYKNSEGYHGYTYDGSSPVAAAILNYIRNNF